MEAQRLAQKQLNQPWYISQHNINNAAKSQSPTHHNYSLDDKNLDAGYDIGGGGGPTTSRLAMMQQAHGQSLNMDGFSGVNMNSPNMMQRNNAKRNTLRRARRIADGSVEDFAGVGAGAGVNDLTPQQIMLMRSQQYLNNNNNNANSATEQGSGTARDRDLSLNVNTHRGYTGFQKHSMSPRAQNMTTTNNNNNAYADMNGNSAHANEFNASELISSSAHLPRRKSLPSIVKSFKEDATAHSSSDLNAARIQETFIIENGIRKRVTERMNSNLGAIGGGGTGGAGDEIDLLRKYHSSEYDDDQTPQLPRKIVIESISSLNSKEARSKRTSMPSIPVHLNSRFAHKGMYKHTHIHTCLTKQKKKKNDILNQHH